MGYFFGTCSCHCEGGGCADTGPWCIKLEWDLELDDTFDFGPPVPYVGDATLWIDNATTDGTRTCENGAADSTDRGVDVNPFDPLGFGWWDGEYISYDGVVSFGGSGECLYIGWLFNFDFLALLLEWNAADGTLAEGVNVVNESAGGGQYTLTGTVTLTITRAVPDIGDCTC